MVWHCSKQSMTCLAHDAHGRGYRAALCAVYPSARVRGGRGAAGTSQSRRCAGAGGKNAQPSSEGNQAVFTHQVSHLRALLALALVDDPLQDGSALQVDLLPVPRRTRNSNCRTRGVLIDKERCPWGRNCRHPRQTGSGRFDAFGGRAAASCRAYVPHLKRLS